MSRVRSVAVLIAGGEVDASRAFDWQREAELWADGAAAGADAFGGDDCRVLVLPRDEGELAGLSDYLRGEVQAAVAKAKKPRRRGAR